MLNLTKAADIMRRELFAPLGLLPPVLPVTEMSRLDVLFEGMDGVTYYNDFTEAPEAIKILPEGPPLILAATLAHEMVHTMLPYEEGHDGRFPSLTTAIGLEGEPSSSKPGPKFVEFYNAHLAGIADA